MKMGNTFDTEIQYCRYCGKRIESDSNYCKYCGKLIREINSQEVISLKKIITSLLTDKKPQPRKDYLILWLRLQKIFMRLMYFISVILILNAFIIYIIGYNFGYIGDRYGIGEEYTIKGITITLIIWMLYLVFKRLNRPALWFRYLIYVIMLYGIITTSVSLTCTISCILYFLGLN